MHVSRPDEMDWEVISNHRETTIEFKRLIQGEPDTPENFELSLVKMRGHYSTPQHHHNFEQVRLALIGPMGYGPDKAQPEGSVGYFPEGSFYTQNVDEGQVTMILQCGGASGGGFLSYDQLRAGAKELSSVGRFEDGVYKGRPGDNRTNKDGYEAVWEHVRGEELVYPAPRYEDHLIMLPDAYLWRETGIDGVAVKHLATVTERRLALEYYRFAPGAPRPFRPCEHQTLLFVVDGRGTVNDEPVDRHDAIGLEPGEAVEITAEIPIEVFAMTLPKVPALASLGEETDSETGTARAKARVA